MSSGTIHPPHVETFSTLTTPPGRVAGQGPDSPEASFPRRALSAPVAFIRGVDMNERTMKLIEDAGRECVRQLLLADTYDKAGQLSDAQTCFGNAQAEADFAFTVARSTVN